MAPTRLPLCAYKVDFGEFIKYCDGIEKSALPAHPHSVVDFIIKLTNSGRSSASIRRAIAGIASVHKLNRFTDPTKDPDVMLEMRRMHRKLGRASHQALGVTAEILEKMLNATESNLKGIRDRALLLVAYDTLCRRSELVALRVEDVKTRVINGVENTTILLRKSKTDQDAIGKWLHLSRELNLHYMIGSTNSMQKRDLYLEVSIVVSTSCRPSARDKLIESTRKLRERAK